jgi:hypothetical protein
MFKVDSENYAEVKECLVSIFDQVEQIGDQIVRKDAAKPCHVVFYFVSDWKMLAIVTGLKQANSRYSCIWCVCDKDEFAKRSFNLFRHVPLCPNRIRGLERESILPKNIPVTNVLIDTLHLFLRISEKLINKVLDECKNLDGVCSEQTYDPRKHTHVSNFINFMKNECNINYYVFKTDKRAIQAKSLNGTDLLKALERINVIELLSGKKPSKSYRHRLRLQKIIDDFYMIYSDLKDFDMSPREIRLRTSKWIQNCSIVFDGKVTPYMHVFHRHLTTQVKRHGRIYLFNLEGLEKQNSITTKSYFRASNMKGMAAIKQIFSLFLRVKSTEKILKVNF